MSYSGATKAKVAAHELAAAVARMDVPDYIAEDTKQAVRDHIQAASKAVKAVMDEHVLHHPDEDDEVLYTASLSGHANPEHKRTPGWSDDFMNLQIHRHAKPKKAE